MPEPNTTSTWDFAKLILTSIGIETQTQDELKERTHGVFWPAWNILRDTRLVYETVMILKKEKKELPKATPRAKPKFETVEYCVMPLRINDAHADRRAVLQSWIIPSGEHGFYTNKDNQFKKPEGCWFLWPWSPEAGFFVKGVWSLRFRCSTPETANGIDGWKERLWFAHQRLIEQGTLEDMTPAS